MFSRKWLFVYDKIVSYLKYSIYPLTLKIPKGKKSKREDSEWEIWSPDLNLYEMDCIISVMITTWEICMISNKSIKWVCFGALSFFSFSQCDWSNLRSCFGTMILILVKHCNFFHIFCISCWMLNLAFMLLRWESLRSKPCLTVTACGCFPSYIVCLASYIVSPAV